MAGVLFTLPAWQHADTVLAFASMPDEPDTADILRQALAEGKRLLRFDHDRTRRHSPIIDSMGEIFIVENKSLAAYLRQLGKMGEDPEDYASIWAYTHGETEPRFGLYVYPDFGFATTDRVSNLELE